MPPRRLLAPLLAACAAGASLAVTPAYRYEALLSQRSLRGGSFVIDGQPWSCLGTLMACQGQLTLPAPTVKACQALAGRVGAIARFARIDGAALRPDELVACNLQARPQPPAAPPRRLS